MRRSGGLAGTPDRASPRFAPLSSHNGLLCFAASRPGYATGAQPRRGAPRWGRSPAQARRDLRATLVAPGSEGSPVLRAPRPSPDSSPAPGLASGALGGVWIPRCLFPHAPLRARGMHSIFLPAAGMTPAASALYHLRWRCLDAATKSGSVQTLPPRGRVQTLPHSAPASRLCHAGAMCRLCHGAADGGEVKTLPRRGSVGTLPPAAASRLCHEGQSPDSATWRQRGDSATGRNPPLLAAPAPARVAPPRAHAPGRVAKLAGRASPSRGGLRPESNGCRIPERWRCGDSATKGQGGDSATGCQAPRATRRRIGGYGAKPRLVLTPAS